MRKVYFFGTGNCAKMYADKSEIALKALGNYEIMGFLDNDVNKEGTQFGKYKVFKPDILKEHPCDLVLIFLMTMILIMFTNNYWSMYLSIQFMNIFCL